MVKLPLRPLLFCTRIFSTRKLWPLSWFFGKTLFYKKHHPKKSPSKNGFDWEKSFLYTTVTCPSLFCSFCISFLILNNIGTRSDWLASNTKAEVPHHPNGINYLQSYLAGKNCGKIKDSNFPLQLSPNIFSVKPQNILLWFPMNGHYQNN